jgi:hypothetical protein
VVSGELKRADLLFREFPQSDFEEPRTDTLLAAGLYADAVIDGSGILNGGALTDDGSEPTRKVLFGGAVANAAAVIAAEGAGLVNYNLDGDRGYGWKTWRPKFPSKPAVPPVQWEVEP